MNKEEANFFYTDLIEYLKLNNLNWIAEQVEEQIALGHIETKKLNVPKKNSYDSNEIYYSFIDEDSIKELPQSKNKKSNAIFVVSTPYSEHEKLKLLIDSIEIGVAKLSEIINTTLEFFHREVQQSQLLFEPEADIKESYEITFDEATNAYINSRKLIPLFNELRKEL
ncbi:hypothetical protein [Desulfitobacterium chlororespirans]|uniref:Uncharacterized protein n=1 Tax=Desulfitobacterium chlororespirans DSM 11544 TaxID=1121395 RepID=A0A1M7UNG4_9FIRM|nr:hypothetical protein [Desulfitobacterium chlororespirans]SHN84519.1 hypothetical protein SAMN02745215_04258 [Desulfitobacterium chlororespirans DSM 11544]